MVTIMTSSGTERGNNKSPAVRPCPPCNKGFFIKAERRNASSRAWFSIMRRTALEALIEADNRA